MSFYLVTIVDQIATAATKENTQYGLCGCLFCSFRAQKQKTIRNIEDKFRTFTLKQALSIVFCVMRIPSVFSSTLEGRVTKFLTSTYK